ncbi:DUF4397 domain-containing protein [Chitinophaga niabensis]|uniref:DUF4397 domain-containing protein n=1 Tax=Chitinophaga niabensis TaxID=536979 RepID=UPI0031BB7129
MKSKNIYGLLAFVLPFMFWSCKKEGVTYENINTSTVMLFNSYAVSSTPAITADAYFNGQKINMGAFGYTTLVSNLVVNAGNKKIAFKKSSDSSLLAQGDFNLAEGTVNTLYLTGTPDDGAIVTTVDDLTPAPAGKARIRAIHLSPNLTAADFYMVGGPVVTKALTYKSFTEYMEVDTGSYVFQVRDAATLSVKGATASIRLASTRNYTFIARGLVGRTPALTLQILNNIKPY